MNLKNRISMHSAMTTETPDFFFFYASMIGLSLYGTRRYRCTVPYRTVRYGTVQGHKYVTWAVFNR